MTIKYRQHILYPAFTVLLLSASSTGFTATQNWQGPYAGAFLGGGFGNNHVSTDAGTITSSSYFTTTADVNAVNTAGTTRNTPSSAFFGILAGHDWVWKQMVYGVVADYGALPLSSSTSVSKVYPDNTDTYSVYTSMSTNWLFTLRGKLGYQTSYQWPGVLYLTAGMAMTKLKVNNSFSDNSSLSGLGGTSHSENQIGWTVGAGYELASFGHATLDLEYLYVSVPSVSANSSIYNSVAGFGVPVQSQSSPFSSSGSFHTSLLRLGLNYRFNE